MARSTPIEKRIEKLKTVLGEHKKGLILIYGNPDPDAIGSALALREVLKKLNVTALIRYTGAIGRLENEAMLRQLRIPASSLAPAELTEPGLVAVVDAQPDFFKGMELPAIDLVFDHHPRRGRIQTRFSDVRPHCLSTSSIVTEYLLALNIPIEARLATALYYGIITDSRNLQKAFTREDIQAMMALDRKVNRVLLRRIEFSCYSLNLMDYFNIALIKMRFARHVIYSHIGPVPSADVCSQIADFLIRVKEASWALVSGVVGRKLIVVFRCDGYRGHAGRAAEAAFGACGSAGGHRTMGRAEVEAEALPDGVLLTNNEGIETYVLESLARVEHRFATVLRESRSLFKTHIRT